MNTQATLHTNQSEAPAMWAASGNAMHDRHIWLYQSCIATTPKRRPFCPNMALERQPWFADAYRAVQRARQEREAPTLIASVNAAWAEKNAAQSVIMNAEGERVALYHTRQNADRQMPNVSWDEIRLAQFKEKATQAVQLDVNMIYCKKTGQPYGVRTEASLASLLNEFDLTEASKLGEFICLASGTAPGWESLSPETLTRKRKFDPRGYFCYAVGTLVRRAWQTRKNNQLIWETTPYITFHNSLVRLWHATADIPAPRLETLNARFALWLQVLGSAPEHFGSGAKHWLKLPADFVALAPHFFAMPEMQAFIEKEIEKRALEIQRDITNRLQGKITGPVADLATLAPLLRESRYLLENSTDYQRGNLKLKANRLMALQGLKFTTHKRMPTISMLAVKIDLAQLFANKNTLKAEVIAHAPVQEMRPVSLGFKFNAMNTKKD